MSALIVQTLGISLVALVVLLALERRGWRGLGFLQRLALVILLVYPALVWLPKWHVLPAVSAGGDMVATPSHGAGGWLLAIWLGGVLAHAGRLFFAMAKLARWKNAANSLTDESDLTLSAECAGALGLRRRVDVRIGGHPGGAAACGVWRPVVLLPREWTGWSVETKRAVLLHEMGHHASRDPLWRMVSLTAAAVYWFNPLVWWLAARLQSQAEFACDARVVGCGFRVDRYAHILCDLASRAPATAMAMATPGGLEQRVRMLQRPRGAAAPLLLGAAAVILGACALGVAVLRPGRIAATTDAQPAPAAAVYTPEEIGTRQSADPFPAD